MPTAPSTRELQRTAPASTAPRAGVSRVPYLPGLDGLRALAVVAVMVYHANVAWLPGGFLGVEVFFVISGYLITLLIIAEREKTGRLDMKQFWMRRARRLLPALFLMMFLVVVYTTLFERDSLGQLRGDVVAGLTYVMNWYQIWVGQGYTASGDFAPLRHLWSLAVEEQFYLIWPLVMVALLAKGTRQIARTAVWLVGIAIGITLVMAVAYQPGVIGTCTQTPEQYWTIGDRCISKMDTLYLSSITRAGGILLGAAFAMLWRPYAIMRSPVRSKGPLLDLLALVAVIGLGAMAWWVFLVDPTGADPVLFRGGFFLCAVLTLMIIAAITHRGAKTGPILGNVVLLWIGTRSYGLYLYHWPIYQAIRKVAGNPLSLQQFVVAMVLTFIVTEISYRFVETPIRTGHARRWWAGLRRSPDPLPRQLVLGTAAIMVALGLFSGVSLATAPLQQNEIAESLDQAADAVVDLGDLIGGGAGGGADDAGEPDTPVVTGPEATTPPEPTTGPGPDPTTAPGPDPTTSPEPTAPPPTAPPTTEAPASIPLLAVGDSVMLGAANQLRDGGLVVDAQESRQMASMVPVMQQLRDEGRLGIGVVVHLGTNGTIGSDTLEAFMESVRDVPNVVVMTLRANRSWIPGNNERLRALSSRPNVTLLDWEQQSSACPGECFYADGIHLRPEGQRYYAQLVFDALGL